MAPSLRHPRLRCVRTFDTAPSLRHPRLRCVRTRTECARSARRPPAAAGRNVYERSTGGPKLPTETSVDYPFLAWALLERGDTHRDVIAFLCNEYGLAPDQAKAALVLARQFPLEDTPPRYPPPQRFQG